MGSSSSKKEQEEKEKREREEQEAKQKCIETKAMLEEKIKQSEELATKKFQEIKKLEEEARIKVREGDKTAAKRILVKKKRLQQMVDTLNNQLQMMDDQVINLENAIYFGAIMSTIKNTNQILNDNKVTLDEIQEESEQINDLKNQNVEFNQKIEDLNNENVDEDELDDELKKCENELEDEIKLPSANKETLKGKEKEKNLDDEINMYSL